MKVIAGDGPVVAAKNIRMQLKESCPGVNFQVAVRRYAGGNSVSIHWTDGPATREVALIVAPYERGDFDPTDDSYDFHDREFANGSAQYIHCNRHDSNWVYSG